MTYRKEYYTLHREEIIARVTSYANTHKKERAAYFEKWYARNKKIDAFRKKQKIAMMREKLFMMYGAHCSCCGEDGKRFLTLAHLNGDGAKHRREKQSAYSILKDALDANDPSVYSIQCFNCNTGAMLNGGICPHKDEETERHQKKSYSLKYHAVLRENVFKLYGSLCHCCGESDRRFLTLAHLNHDGNEHRKRRGQWGVFRDAIAVYNPRRYGIECLNCNIGASFNNGVCPHEGR